MVTLYRMWIRTSQNQKTNWIGGKGFDVEEPVKNQIRQMLQKKWSRYTTLIVRRRTIWNPEFKLQFQSFLRFRKGSFLAGKRHTTGTQKLKRYTGEYLLSSIYWRFYWPGSYAPRGVIDQYICLQMGAPLFLLALLSTQTQEVCNSFSL